MIELINYDNYIKSKIINHNDSIYTYQDAIKYLIDSKSDIISYNTKKTLMLFNIAILKVDKNNNYIYEYIIEKQFDIIDNIHFISSNKNVKMIFIIGNEEYDNINTFIGLLSQNQEFKLKFIFTEPRVGNEIFICYKNYLLNSNEKYLLNNVINVSTDTNIYSNGLCKKI
jgi:hypothetical protein